jgi:hypothetical protein
MQEGLADVGLAAGSPVDVRGPGEAPGTGERGRDGGVGCGCSLCQQERKENEESYQERNWRSGNLHGTPP